MKQFGIYSLYFFSIYFQMHKHCLYCLSLMITFTSTIFYIIFFYSVWVQVRIRVHVCVCVLTIMKRTRCVHDLNETKIKYKLTHNWTKQWRPWTYIYLSQWIVQKNNNEYKYKQKIALHIEFQILFVWGHFIVAIHMAACLYFSLCLLAYTRASCQTIQFVVLSWQTFYSKYF